MTAKLLSPKETAVRASVCTSVVYGWISAGLLACYRLGRPGKRGAIRIEESDLEAFLASQKQEGRQAAPPPVPKAPPIKLKHLQL